MELHLKGHENLAVLTGLGQVSILVDVFSERHLDRSTFPSEKCMAFSLFRLTVRRGSL